MDTSIMCLIEEDLISSPQETRESKQDGSTQVIIKKTSFFPQFLFLLFFLETTVTGD